jgi:hypothetical protein
MLRYVRRSWALPRRRGYRLVVDLVRCSLVATQDKSVCQTSPRANRMGIRFCWDAGKVTGRAWKPVRYAAVGDPNQVVSASTSPGWVKSPTQATYPSGRTNTAVGAVTGPRAGSSHGPTYLASTNWTRSAHGGMSKAPGSPRVVMNVQTGHSHSGCAAAKPCEPTRTLRRLHSFDHCKDCVHGDYHYEGRQYNQPIIEIN